LPAFPPGLSVGLVPSVTPGRLPMGSGVVVVIGSVVGVGVADEDDVGEAVVVGDEVALGGAVILTEAVAFGLWVRSVAVPVTVTVSEVTDEAVVGTVVCAWSCRWADVPSISPRSQEAVPSEVPQPKLNFGVAPAAFSAMTASLTSPPVDQAVTVQVVAAPRAVDVAAVVISTHRSTWPGVAATASVRALEVAVPVAEREGVAEADGDGLFFGEAELGDLVGEGLALLLALGDLDGVGVGFGVVWVGVGVGEEDAVAVGDELAGFLAEALDVADADADADADGVVDDESGALAGAVDVEAEGVGVLVVGVVDGVAEGVSVGVRDVPPPGGGSVEEPVCEAVGVGVDDEVAALIGSQDWSLEAEAVLSTTT